MVFMLIPLVVVGYRMYEQRKMKEANDDEQQDISDPDEDVVQPLAMCCSSESVEETSQDVVGQIVTQIRGVAEGFQGRSQYEQEGGVQLHLARDS